MVAHLILLAGSLLAGVAGAASGPPQALTAEWQRRLGEADALKKQAREIREAADARFASQEKACYAKFMVTDCIDAAKKERIPHLVEARRQENEARQIERSVRHAQAVESEERQARERAEREAELPARAARVETDARAHEADVAAREREQATKAAEGARRRAEREAQIARRQADHEAKVAARVRAADAEKNRP